MKYNIVYLCPSPILKKSRKCIALNLYSTLNIKLVTRQYLTNGLSEMFKIKCNHSDHFKIQVFFQFLFHGVNLNKDLRIKSQRFFFCFAWFTCVSQALGYIRENVYVNWNILHSYSIINKMKFINYKFFFHKQTFFQEKKGSNRYKQRL